MKKKTISISEAVWDAIVERGRFGESPDDVLRREWLGIDERKRSSGRKRSKKATVRMRANVVDGQLQILFIGGHSKTWNLPSTSDKATLEKVRKDAFAFAKDNNATEGQLAAISKALNEAGFYVRR